MSLRKCLSAFPYSSSYVYEYPTCKESYNNIKIVNLTSDSSKEQILWLIIHRMLGKSTEYTWGDIKHYVRLRYALS